MFYVDTIDLKTLRPTDTHILTFSTRDRDGSREGSEEQSSTSNGDGVPLFTSASNGHIAVVKYLVRAKASLDKAINNGATPFYIAAEEGHTAVVEYLVRACLCMCGNGRVSTCACT